MSAEYERLEKLANKYFGSLSKLSEMLGRSRQFLSSYKNKKGIGRKVLLELQDQLSVNIRYVQYGDEPMLLNVESEKVFTEVTNVKKVSLPDIRTLTPQQMREVKEWIREVVPVIDIILEAVE